eukprot:691795-Alexandrium_andersonii.AAC.1
MRAPCLQCCARVRVFFVAQRVRGLSSATCVCVCACVRVCVPSCDVAASAQARGWLSSWPSPSHAQRSSSCLPCHPLRRGVVQLMWRSAVRLSRWLFGLARCPVVSHLGSQRATALAPQSVTRLAARASHQGCLSLLAATIRVAPA